MGHMEKVGGMKVRTVEKMWRRRRTDY